MGPIISLALMLLLFWVLIVLPQRRRVQAQRSLVAALAVGDEVMTTSGLHGRVVALDDDVAELEIADGVVVRSARWAIAVRKGADEGDDAGDIHDDAAAIDDTAPAADGTADPSGD